MALTKQAILELLSTDKRAVARALVVLHNRQTNDEQAQEGTRYLNGRGFRPCHARMGSSMAKQFLAKGYLSDKQIEYWRKPDRSGSMRIGIYWAQLLEEAELKAKQAKPVTKLPGLEGPAIVTRPTNRDFGNDMERRMILEEQLGDVMDSDDPTIIDPIAEEIDEIDAFWKKIRGNI